MSRKNGAGVTRSKRTRVPLAAVVNVLGAVAAVDLDGVDAVAALVEVAAVARVPDHLVVAVLAEDLVVAGAAGQDVIAVAAEEQIVAALAQQGVVAGLAEEQVVAASRRSGCRCHRRRRDRHSAARRWSRRARGCRCRPGQTSGSSSVLATVACPPLIATAPPLTRSVPAASRLTTIVLFAGIADDRSKPAAGENVAVIAGMTRLSSGSRPTTRAVRLRRNARRRSRPDRNRSLERFFDMAVISCGWGGTITSASRRARPRAPGRGSSAGPCFRTRSGAP